MIKGVKLFLFKRDYSYRWLVDWAVAIEKTVDFGVVFAYFIN